MLLLHSNLNLKSNIINGFSIKVKNNSALAYFYWAACTRWTKK